jgi:hypothetical protein
LRVSKSIKSWGRGSPGKNEVYEGLEMKVEEEKGVAGSCPPLFQGDLEQESISSKRLPDGWI